MSCFWNCSFGETWGLVIDPTTRRLGSLNMNIRTTWHSTHERCCRSADMDEDSDVINVSQRPIKAR